MLRVFPYPRPFTPRSKNIALSYWLQNPSKMLQNSFEGTNFAVASYRGYAAFAHKISKLPLFGWFLGARKMVFYDGNRAAQVRCNANPLLTPLQMLRTGKSDQRGSFWDGRPADIRGSFARISRPKTSVRAVKI